MSSRDAVTLGWKVAVVYLIGSLARHAWAALAEVRAERRRALSWSHTWGRIPHNPNRRNPS